MVFPTYLPSWENLVKYWPAIITDEKKLYKNNFGLQTFPDPTEPMMAHSFPLGTIRLSWFKVIGPSSVQLALTFWIRMPTSGFTGIGHRFELIKPFSLHSNPKIEESN